MIKGIKILKKKLSPKIWSDKKKEIEPYLSEERGRISGKSNLILKPRNTAEATPKKTLLDLIPVLVPNQ